MVRYDTSSRKPADSSAPAVVLQRPDKRIHGREALGGKKRNGEVSGTQIKLQGPIPTTPEQHALINSPCPYSSSSEGEKYNLDLRVVSSPSPPAAGIYAPITSLNSLQIRTSFWSIASSNDSPPTSRGNERQKHSSGRGRHSRETKDR